MSLELGTAAFEAVNNLKASQDWRQVVHALNDKMSSLMNRALEVPPAERVDATSYARALRDLVAYIEFVEAPQRPGNHVPKPAVRARGRD